MRGTVLGSGHKYRLNSLLVTGSAKKNRLLRLVPVAGLGQVPSSIALSRLTLNNIQPAARLKLVNYARAVVLPRRHGLGAPTACTARLSQPMRASSHWPHFSNRRCRPGIRGRQASRVKSLGVPGFPAILASRPERPAPMPPPPHWHACHNRALFWGKSPKSKLLHPKHIINKCEVIVAATGRPNSLDSRIGAINIEYFKCLDFSYFVLLKGMSSVQLYTCTH